MYQLALSLASYSLFRNTHTRITMYAVCVRGNIAIPIGRDLRVTALHVLSPKRSSPRRECRYSVELTRQ